VRALAELFASATSRVWGRSPVGNYLVVVAESSKLYIHPTR